MTSISVALATFNGQDYLDAQLASLASQTLSPSELVVADDGSADATVAKIREFARTSSFSVRVLQNTERLGYRDNFIQVASACSGDLIAFCDQDDIWHPDKLAIVREAFEDPDVLLAYHNSTLIDKSGAAMGRIFPRRIRGKTFEPLTIKPAIIIPGHAQIVRRSLNCFTPLHAGSIDPYHPEQRAPHDHWYLFWASVLGKITYVPMPLVDYRQHEANSSGWPHPSLSAFVLDHIANAEKYATSDVIGAKNRLQMLRQSSAFLESSDRARVAEAISYYEGLAGRGEQRLAIYTSRHFSDRARSLLRLVARGVYAPTGSGDALGLDALLLDACIGTCFSRVGRM